MDKRMGHSLGFQLGPVPGESANQSEKYDNSRAPHHYYEVMNMKPKKVNQLDKPFSRASELPDELETLAGD